MSREDQLRVVRILLSVIERLYQLEREQGMQARF